MIDLHNFFTIGKTGFYLKKNVWGNAKDEEVMSVLQSILEIFADSYGNDYIQRHNIYTIILKGSPPRCFYGNKKIQLNVSGCFWCKYAYQFSHELYHYISMSPKVNKPSKHLWFEEMLANMHSYFIIDKLSYKWKIKPPYPNWVYYSDAFQEYYVGMIEDDKTDIHIDELAVFLYNNIPLWEKNPYDEDYIGKRLRRYDSLSPILYENIFRSNKHSWESLKKLHEISDNDSNKMTFHEYLETWFKRCNETERLVVTKIAEMFRLSLTP